MFCAPQITSYFSNTLINNPFIKNLGFQISTNPIN